MFAPLSPETAALHEALITVPIGETITYAALTEAIGRNAAREGRASLESARRIALRDQGIAFAVVRKVGLRRLRAEEAPEIGCGYRRKIRRTAGRALYTMQRVAETSNGLAPDAQRRLNAEMSAHGLLGHLAKDNATRAFEADKAMPAAKAGRAFLEHIGATPKTQETDHDAAGDTVLP